LRTRQPYPRRPVARGSGPRVRPGPDGSDLGHDSRSPVRLHHQRLASALLSRAWRL